MQALLPSLAFATAALVTFGSAAAQTYPSRPITMVVPFGPGGSTDTIGRIVAEGMRGPLGQSVVVENAVGAGGSIGVGRVARAAGDGYTLGIGAWSTHVVNGAVYALPYDLANDFEPIALIADNPLLIITKKAIPARALRELIDWLKANPEKASQGTAGIGTAGHIGGVFFQSVTGTRFPFVPYRGGAAPAMQDLVAGQIDLMIDLSANALPQVRAGTVKVYAVTANNRLAVASDIPTVDEAGLPGVHFSLWHALWAPKRTPKDIIGKLNAAVVDALADPSVRQRLAQLGQEIFPRERQTPESLGAFHRAEIEKWWPIIKGANIKAE